ncbi:MAG: Patatin-like phospholipase [bacterium ADurb.BinA186]|nr:MAG: Patatin-like phospholipase [bacterium ADurb.BinA186]
MRIFVTAFQLSTLRARHFDLLGLAPEKCASILLACSAIPGVFPVETIDGEGYLDGGMPVRGCNTPVEALKGEGYDLIITVLLRNDASFDPGQFPHECVLPLFPKESLGSFVKGTLDFQGTNAEERIKRGYEDTRNAFETSLKLSDGSMDLNQLQDIAKAQREHWQLLQEQTPKPKIERIASQIGNFLPFKKGQ